MNINSSCISNKHNKSVNLLNEIRQIIYSLYQTKGPTKKVYSNVMNWIKL